MSQDRAHLIVAAVLLILCGGLYIWTADYPMVFDDHTYLKDNMVFHDPHKYSYLAHFSEFANMPTRMGIDPDLAVNFILRPFAYATFDLNKWLDDFNPRWYRIANILIHFAGALLIYRLLDLLLSLAGEKSRSLSRGSRVFIPACAALMFAAHPLATESVTYIIQRFTSLATTLYLLALWLHFRSVGLPGQARTWWLAGCSTAAMLAGMLTKEICFTAPLMAVLIDRVVLGTDLKEAVRRATPLLVCLPIIPLLVFMTAAVHNDGSLSWSMAQNIVNSRHEPIHPWHYAVTQLTVMTAYLRRIFWPSGLNLDPDWPLYRSLLETPVLMALAVLLPLLGFTAWLWHRWGDDVRLRMAFVFTAWFFITISVSSSFVPLPDLMAEHRCYLPSAGIFILVAALLDRLRMTQAPWRLTAVAIPMLAVLLTGALAWATIDRNKVYVSTESLWRDASLKSPNKFRVWGNLGVAYSHQGRNEEALKCYEQALEIEPRYQNGIFNMSNTLLSLGRPAESLKYSQELIEMDESNAARPAVAYTLSLGLVGVGRFDDAISVLSNVLHYSPDDPMAHKYLGVAYHRKGRPDKALPHYRRAAKLLHEDGELPKLIEIAQSALPRTTPQ